MWCRGYTRRQTGTQTHTLMRSLQYFATAAAGKVKMVQNDLTTLELVTQKLQQL